MIVAYGVIAVTRTLIRFRLKKGGQGIQFVRRKFVCLRSTSLVVNISTGVLYIQYINNIKLMIKLLQYYCMYEKGIRED